MPRFRCWKRFRRLAPDRRSGAISTGSRVAARTLWLSWQCLYVLFPACSARWARSPSRMAAVKCMCTSAAVSAAAEIQPDLRIGSCLTSTILSPAFIGRCAWGPLTMLGPTHYSAYLTHLKCVRGRWLRAVTTSFLEQAVFSSDTRFFVLSASSAGRATLRVAWPVVRGVVCPGSGTSPRWLREVWV